MSRLLHDRYYAYAAEHAWDLATGESVPLTDMTSPSSTSTEVAGPLVEVLDHGREGEPRWVVVETGSGAQSLAVARRIAEHARVRGLVPISVDVYLRLRTLLDADLRHRTLMLILSPGSSLDLAREAMIVAAATSPRPHVLVSFRSIHTLPHATKEDRSGRPCESGQFVREARAVYGAGVSLRPAVKVLSEEVRRHMARGAKWLELCEAGRHASADRLLRDVAGALVRRQAFAPAATMLIALGRLALERGRASDAESIFGDAATHAQRAKEEDLSAAARIWQAAREPTRRN